MHPELPPDRSVTGRAALQAVLQPERLNVDGQQWLYFLHGSAEGEPVFRPNISYDDHAGYRAVPALSRRAGADVSDADVIFSVKGEVPRLTS